MARFADALRVLFGRRPANEPIDRRLWSRVLRRYRFLEGLGPDAPQLYEMAANFLRHKQISAAGGLALSDFIRVAIAAQACLPVLKLGLAGYSDFVSIIVYPGEFVTPRSIVDDAGVVHEYDEVAVGEAWPGGPVVLGWEGVARGDTSYNVVIHEFAHKLDMLSGEVDGTPPLRSVLARNRWREVIGQAYADFCARLESGQETWIDPYAAKDVGEFFAVISECFFTSPNALRREYAELYAQLRGFYAQDPASRLAE